MTVPLARILAAANETERRLTRRGHCVCCLKVPHADGGMWHDSQCAVAPIVALYDEFKPSKEAAAAGAQTKAKPLETEAENHGA